MHRDAFGPRGVHLQIEHAQHLRAFSEEVVVRPSAHVRTEVDVEALLESLDLAALVGIHAKQSRLGSLTIDPREDLGGVREHALARGERGRAVLSAHRSHGGEVEPRKVGRLAIGDCGNVERPAGFLAEVTERDGDENGHVHGANLSLRRDRLPVRRPLGHPREAPWCAVSCARRAGAHRRIVPRVRRDKCDYTPRDRPRPAAFAQNAAG